MILTVILALLIGIAQLDNEYVPINQQRGTCAILKYITALLVVNVWHPFLENRLMQKTFAIPKWFMTILGGLSLLVTFLLFRFDITKLIVSSINRWRYEYISLFLVNLIFMYIITYIISHLHPQKYNIVNNLHTLIKSGIAVPTRSI